MSKKTKKRVGIVMPISERDGLKENHWKQVKDIIIRACNSIEDYDVSADLVSIDDSNDIIVSRIIENLYSCDLVICDVSTSNANVMFELGIRLAFAKPIIIIKDDVTSYNFDLSSIEHVNYDRTLRFQLIEVFMKDLANKATNILKNYEDGKYKSYIDTLSIKNYSPTNISEGEVNFQTDVIQLLNILNGKVNRIQRTNQRISSFSRDMDIPERFPNFDMQTLYETVRKYVNETEAPGLPDTLKYVMDNMYFESAKVNEISSAIKWLDNIHGFGILPF